MKHISNSFCPGNVWTQMWEEACLMSKDYEATKKAGLDAQVNDIEDDRIASIRTSTTLSCIGPIQAQKIRGIQYHIMPKIDFFFIILIWKSTIKL